MRGWDVGVRAAGLEVEARQGTRQARTERKRTSRAVLRHAHERRWEKKMPGRKRAVSAQRRGGALGKCNVMETREGAESISRKRQRQGSRVEQEVGGPGPPVLLGRPCLDLSQLRTISVNFMRVRRRGGG